MPMFSTEKNPLKDTASITIVRMGGHSVRMARSTLYALGVLLLTCIAIAAVFPYTSVVQFFHIPNEGEVATETIIAPITFDILKAADEIEKEKVQAQEDVLLVLDYEPGVHNKVRKKFVALKENIRAVARKHPSDSVRSALKAALARDLSEASVQVFLRNPKLIDEARIRAEQLLENGVMSILLVPNEARLFQMKSQYNASFENYRVNSGLFVTLRRGVSESAVKSQDITVKEVALDELINEMKKQRRFDENGLSAIYEILYAYIVPNVSLNQEETEKRRLNASGNVVPFKGKVIKDSEIVRKHQVVTPDILAKLRSLQDALDKNREDGQMKRIVASNAGKLSLVLLALMFASAYISVFYPELVTNRKHLLALSCIVIFQVSIIRIFIILLPRLFGGGGEISHITPEFVVPVAVGAVLAAMLFDIQISFAVSIFVSIFFGAALGFNYSMFLFALLTGLTAGFTTRGIRYRWDFFRSIPPAALIICLYIFLWHLITFKLAIPQMLQDFGIGLVNCVSTTFLSMMVVAVFEYLFDITTDMTLVELSDMNHPLLKKLSIEAAGTYNHSVLVANLAESAAASINANPLLARVASYYHDIGKVNRPGYFVENQIFDKNVHDKLTPNMSALIISSHVQDGIEMARKFRLPSLIRNAIAQHHGTSKVSFFYQKALELDPHGQVEEKDYCYPGPRPQSRENAIIMLADSVEAASRSIATSSPGLLRELVKKIIHDKFASSQLDECNLTFKDLDRIVEGFMPVLQGIFHTRIEYPAKK
jgi:putative nucleotidyltransferase with HDIG domain